MRKTVAVGLTGAVLFGAAGCSPSNKQPTPELGWYLHVDCGSKEPFLDISRPHIDDPNANPNAIGQVACLGKADNLTSPYSVNLNNVAEGATYRLAGYAGKFLLDGQTTIITDADVNEGACFKASPMDDKSTPTQILNPCSTPTARP